jgi:hypothetical protein
MFGISRQCCHVNGVEDQLLKEVHQAYSGKMAAAHDLDVY